MRLLSIIACAISITLLGIVPGHADKRVALVIGNAAYQHMPQLPNPRNDATDIGALLQDLGFETIVATDLDRSGFNVALDQFSRIVGGADIAFVYYAGHGMQFAGANYLLPIDARLHSVEDVNRFRLAPVEDILDTMRLANGARILVLDACRNNPVEEDLKRRLATARGTNRDAILTRGFARPSAGNGLLVAYATQANDVANDGTGRNSPFTAALLRHIGTPDIDLRTMLFRVQDDVDRMTNHRQRPELAISLVGEFKLKVTPPVKLEEPKPAPPPAASSVDTVAQDWRAVEHSTTIAMLEAFKRRHPGTFQAELADIRIEDLKKSQTAARPQPAVTAEPAPPGNDAATSLPSTAVAPSEPPKPSSAPPVVAAVAPPVQPASPPTTPVTPAVVAPPVAPEPPPSTTQPIPAVVAPPSTLPAPVDPCGGAITVSFAAQCAAPLTEAQERDLKAKDSFRECEKCPEMVMVPAGRFSMGSPKNEKNRDVDESPQHAVTIGKPFAVGKFHVTRDQFAAFAAATGFDAGTKCPTAEYSPKQRQPLGSWQDPGFSQDGSHPAVCLGWNDAKAYVDWLARETGKPYRLLTEAEWEYAARAGASTRYFYGTEEKETCRNINAADQTLKDAKPGGNLTFSACRDGYPYTSPVGSFTPNAFGLYDMQGNAWQWTEDCYHDSYQGAPTDGSAWVGGDCLIHGLRGGSWNTNPPGLRVANRLWSTVYEWSRGSGLRVARTLATP